MEKKGMTHRYAWKKRCILPHRAIPDIPYDLLVMDTAETNTKPVLKKYSTVTFKVFTPIEIILSIFQCCVL